MFKIGDKLRAIKNIPIGKECAAFIIKDSEHIVQIADYITANPYYDGYEWCPGKSKRLLELKHYSGIWFNADDFTLIEPDPVAGSKEWAVEMMKQGKKVQHIADDKYHYWSFENGRVFCTCPSPSITINKFLTVEAMPDGWQIYEPAKLNDVKVNQYVKLSNGEQVRVHENNNLKQELVLWTLDNNWFGYADYEGNIYHLKGKLTIVHIIPPDEMRVKITLETIIKKDETRDDFFWAYINGLWICMDINKIPPDQAEQVMALLKAQEGK